MKGAARSAYAQARLQARHGMRPDAQVWRRLASVGDLANYLQVAQHTMLRPWVLGMQASKSSHAIELLLRQQFRRYVQEVSQWLPVSWGPSVRWVKHMPDLPAMQHLLRGEIAYPWMLEDPELRPYTAENVASRLDAIRNSGLGYLVRAWQQGTALHDAWLEQWQLLWPAGQGPGTGLKYLGRLLRQYLQALHAAPGSPTEQQREILVSGLNFAFRRYSFEPAATCAHLGLIALDLEKLRGELVRRALFSEVAQVQP
jgi:hypothetical protein